MLFILAAAALIAVPLKLDGTPYPNTEGYPSFHGVTRPGIAVLDIVVDPAGRVVRCDVVDAGTSARLGYVGCNAARAARFRPALDAAGLPIAALLRHRYAVERQITPFGPAPIDFGIPIDRLPAAATNPILSVYVVTDAEAKVSDCEVAHTSGNRALDDLACRTLRTADLPPARDGEGRILRAVRWLSVGFVVGDSKSQDGK